MFFQIFPKHACASVPRHAYQCISLSARFIHVLPNSKHDTLRRLLQNSSLTRVIQDGTPARGSIRVRGALRGGKQVEVMNRLQGRTWLEPGKLVEAVSKTQQLFQARLHKPIQKKEDNRLIFDAGARRPSALVLGRRVPLELPLRSGGHPFFIFY